MTDEEDADRERGVLTPADRRYLRGETVYDSVQSARDTRYRIRERLRNAILDFNLVTAYMGSDDLERVLDDLSPESFDGMRMVLNSVEPGPDRPLLSLTTEADPALARAELHIAARYVEVGEFDLARSHIRRAEGYMRRDA